MKVTNKTRFGAIAFGCAIAVMFVAAGSASAQLTWGPTEDVVVDGSVNEVHPTAEFGFSPFEFNSLTVTGGYLEGDRIYGGAVQDHVITISGGHLKDAGGVTILGYDFNTTVNQSGGILESAGLTAIGRNAATTEFNMTGGQWLIGSDPPGGSGNVYMPGNDPDCCGGYGTPGVLNFSGGEIVIKAEDWSPGGFDILAQSWFNNQGIGTQAVWDGAQTTITSDSSAVPGDANDDGFVTTADLQIVLDNYFRDDPPLGTSDGEFTFDNKINHQDYLFWKTEFIAGGGSQAAIAAYLAGNPVPEPSSLALLISVAAWWPGRRWRRPRVAT